MPCVSWRRRRGEPLVQRSHLVPFGLISPLGPGRKLMGGGGSALCNCAILRHCEPHPSSQAWTPARSATTTAVPVRDRVGGERAAAQRANVIVATMRSSLPSPQSSPVGEEARRGRSDGGGAWLPPPQSSPGGGGGHTGPNEGAPSRARRGRSAGGPRAPRRPRRRASSRLTRARRRPPRRSAGGAAAPRRGSPRGPRRRGAATGPP